ncbi:MAG: ABC transporter permease [Longimicrobiaceae bacterium]
METLLQDLRFAFRSLLRSPGFTAAVILTLALGIGATTAIFGILDAVLFRPLPYADADRLAMVWEHDRFSGTEREPASVPDYYDFRERSRAFAELAAFQERQASLAGSDGEARQLSLGAAGHQLFPLLGVRPLLGRVFGAAEDREGAAPVVVLGEGLWRDQFGGSAEVLGSTVRLDGIPHTVVGVVPATLDVPREDTDAWVPLALGPASSPRSLHNVTVVGRMKPGVTARAAQREMTALAARLEAENPGENHGRGVTVEPLHEALFGTVRTPLLLLLGASALVLLVACVNVANLLLVRGAGRTREVAIRAALGATRRRLARQLLVESLLLALLGGAAGVAIAAWGTELLVGLAPAGVPRLEGVGMDGRALAVGLLVALATGCLFGLVPVLQARRVDPQAGLRADGGRGASAAPGAARARRGLVAVEVALSVVLVVGAGLLVHSLWRLQRVDPGFRTENVLRASFVLPASRYPQSYDVYPRWSEVTAFQRELLERARALPGVRSAALASHHPLAPGFTNSFVIEGREDEAADQAEIPLRAVSPEYFATVGVPLLRGRLLSPRDDADAPAVLLVNEAAARRFFPGADPVGKRIAFWGTSREIVGVVGNERFHGVAADAPPAAYPPLAQTPMGTATLLLRAAGDPAALVPALRAAVRGLDPEVALYEMETLDRTLSRSISQPRFTTALLGTFAALALLLAVIGVYGVLSYAVAQRTREIGIRVALGARRGEIVRLVVGQGMAPVLAGLALGLAAAFAGARVLSGILFEVAPTDPLAFTAVVPVLGAASLLAAWLPARRAASVDPMTALRTD